MAYDFPNSPTLNQIVTGPAGQQFQWDGVKWIALLGGGGGGGGSGGGLPSNPGTTPPSNPTAGELWYNTSTGVLNVYNGTAWIPVVNTGVATNPGTSAPASPVTGTLWYNTTTDVLNVWSGTSWVPVGTGTFAPVTNPPGGAGNYAPISNPNFLGSVTVGGVALGSIYAPIANPNFTGTVSVGGVALGSLYAPIANPHFTGTVTLGQDATQPLQAVTLEQVQALIAGTGVTSWNSRTGAVSLYLNDMVQAGVAGNVVSTNPWLGYVRLGQITIQWGLYAGVELGYQQSATYNIPYPVAFGGVPITFIGTPVNFSTTGPQTGLTIEGTSENAATVTIYNASTNVTGPGDVYWMAIGLT